MPVRLKSNYLFGTEAFWYTAAAFGSAEIGTEGKELSYLEGLEKVCSASKKDGRKKYDDDHNKIDEEPC